MANPTTFTNLRVKPLTVSASSLTLDPRVHAGKTINMSIAGAQTFTLPAAKGTGDKYRFFCSITATGNKVIQVANASDTMGGTAIVTTDISGVVIPTAATSDTITLNGSTTGGVKGSLVEVIDSATNVWSVACSLVSSGIEATPFSAAV